MIHKKIILIIFLAILIVIFLIWQYFTGIDSADKEVIPRIINNSLEGQPEWELNLRQKAQQEIIAKNGEGYPRGFLSNEIDVVVAAVYLPNFLSQKKITDSNKLNHPEEKKWKRQTRGGVMVFQLKNETLQQIWESQEVMGQPFGRVEFKDLNNDKSDELLVWWSNGKAYWLYIYKWIDGSFKLIIPSEETIDKEGIKHSTFVFAAENIDIIDRENDKVYEVKLPYTKITKFLPDEYGYEIIPLKEEYIRIYKWDGTEKPYYLWREEKIGEEKPEPIE